MIMQIKMYYSERQITFVIETRRTWCFPHIKSEQLALIQSMQDHPLLMKICYKNSDCTLAALKEIRSLKYMKKEVVRCLPRV